MNEADLQRALRDCYDPVLKKNIVELGLVRSAKLVQDDSAPGVGVGPRYVAQITVTAPGSDETLNAQLEAQIANRLAGLPEILRTEVTMKPALFPILR